MNKINNLYIRILFALAVVLLIVMLWVRVNKNEHRIDTLYDVLDTDVSGISFRNNLIKYTHSCLVCSDGYCVQIFGIYR